MKRIPEKITKSFLFEAYSDQLPEKIIRATINYYIKLLGGNIRNKIVSDIVFVSFIKTFGIPNGYEASEQLKIKCKKINITCL
ncbi:hypothetical protein KHA90_04940 [Flavobacterium psychroterrae]|uniref:Uncharacterized protein n=1 Tax=Flavobacterium psychroterrae TaxID=2133767 RepID=A0ABS5P7S1_9FLAO|nr:hypothetical protein [Flavobacterium psychroterrae]MBS7230362.1 hypothetical protein [Flavobacterium psychroterrae]